MHGLLPHRRAVVNQDLAEVGGRWPRFAAEALAAGFRSVHAFPMRLRGTVIGALNLFRVDAGSLEAERPRSPPRPSPTWPPSPSSSTAPLARPRSSTSSSTTRSTAAS